MTVTLGDKNEPSRFKIALTIRQCVRDLTTALKGRILHTGKASSALARLEGLANTLEGGNDDESTGND